MRWLLLLAMALPLTVAGPTVTQPGAGHTWELTGLDQPVLELFTPASGAFFARVTGGLLRSDDAGMSWAAVHLPMGPTRAAVDPTDHTVLYAAGADGLYKTSDDAASWQLVLPTRDNVLALAVSAADPRLVYAAVTSGVPVFRLLRSRDGGNTWDVAREVGGQQSCTWSTTLLQPHPTDANRVFLSAGCYAGRNLANPNFSGPLEQSLDAGTTWAVLFRPPRAFARALAFGEGPAAGRLYLSAHMGPPGQGWLYRSDDDSATWSGMVAVQSSIIGGLASEPTNADRVYIGFSGGGSGVQTSPDGGGSWEPAGRGEIGAVAALALGIDGRNLYAAGERGLWRLRLGSLGDVD